MNIYGKYLTDKDDPNLWEAILVELTVETKLCLDYAKKDIPIYLVLGCCSHWLRPHQTRWSSAGGFAWPAGYGNGDGDLNYSRMGEPELDWSVVYIWEKEKWEPAERIAGKRKVILRVAVPTRTTTHSNAAVHSIWNPGTPNMPTTKRVRFYGFKKEENEWNCVARTNAKVVR